MSTRVVTYSRVSTAVQEDNFSLSTQEAACREFAAEKRWDVVAIEHDVASGANRNRPGLERAIAKIERGEADTLLAHSLDRVSRHQIDVAVIVDRIEAAQGTLVLVTEDFEHSPVGTFIRSARAFAAEVELAKISERTARGRRARLASGKPLAGRRAVFGYQWANEEKSCLEPNEATAPIVRAIFDEYLRGGSIRSIALSLTKRGVPTPTGIGQTWSGSVVQRILSNPIYKGQYTALQRRWERPSRGQPYRCRPSTDDEVLVLPNVAPALVREEEFDAVQSRFAINKQHAIRNNPHPERYLLRAGLVRCGYCGYAMGASSAEKGRAPGHNYKERYVCGNLYCRKVTIATAPLDEAVWKLVQRVLTDPDVIAQEVARTKTENATTIESERAAIERLLEDVAAKQRNAARAIVALGDDDIAAPLRDELRLLSGSRKALEAELGALTQRAASIRDDESRLMAFGEWAHRVSVNLDQLTYDERRMALEALAVSVDVFQVDDADHPRWRVTMRPAVSDDGNIVTRYT